MKFPEPNVYQLDHIIKLLSAPTFRFWAYINDDWVKLSLRPFLYLRWSESHDTDEGWHRSSREWYHDGEKLTLDSVEDGADCDGRLTHTSEMWADKIIPWKPPTEIESADSPTYLVPDWQEKNTKVYDQYAQMMGY